MNYKNKINIQKEKLQELFIKMVETNIAEVALTLYIKRVKEVELVVTVVDGGGATKATSDIIIDPMTIKIAGNETALKDIDEINLGTIHLGELTKDSEKTFEIKLPDELTAANASSPI